MRKGFPRALGLLLGSTAAAASAAAVAAVTKHSALFVPAAPESIACIRRSLLGQRGPAPRTSRSPIHRSSSSSTTTTTSSLPLTARRTLQEDEMARAAPQSKGKGCQSSKVQSTLGKKGAAAKAKKKAAAGTRSSSKKQGQPPQLKKGTQKQKQQQQVEPKAKGPSRLHAKAPTLRRSSRKKTGRSAKIAKPSMTEKRGQGRKSVEDLVEDVELMAEKAGVRLPRGKKKEQEVKQAIAKTSDRPYRDYSKQGALEELKKTHKVTSATGKGDAFSGAPKSPRSKRGINAPPSPAEKKKPPTERTTKRGMRSVRGKVTNKANKPLVNALYDLADFVLHGDTTQKGIAYQKAAKSVREAKEPIKTKDAARNLVGVGQSIQSKVNEFLSKGKIKVLEEYRRGERGK